MSFDDDRSDRPVDALHHLSEPVDLFKDSDQFQPSIVLPDQLTYLRVRAERIDVPQCLQGTLIVKALYYKLHHTNLSEITADSYFSYIRRVFNELDRDPMRYVITDARFSLAQISNAIKALPEIRDINAYNHQIIFSSAMKLVKDPHFTNAEQKLAKQILKHNTAFARPKSDPRDSISVRHPDLPYTDAEYIDSIRRCVFIYHRIWSCIRTAFRTKMPAEYAELQDLLIHKPDLAKRLETETPPLNKRNLGEHYEDVQRVRAILLKAVETLDDPCLTEVMFLSTVYSKVAFEHHYLDQHSDHLSLKPNIDHAKMKTLLQHWHLGRNGQTRYFFCWKGTDTALGSLISPFLLLLPWGGDELGLYAALLLSERAPSSGLHQMTLDQIKFLDKDGVETAENTASRLLVSDIIKNRQGKLGNTEVYDKTTDFFKIFKSLYVDYSAALDSGLLSAGQVTPFKALLRSNGTPGKGLFNTTLAPSTLASSPLVSLVIKGTRTYKLMKRLSTPAFHQLMIAASQRLASYKGGVRKNPELPVWKTISFLVPTAINQSRLIADEAKDLSDVRISDDMGMTYQEEFDNHARQVAKDQFHSVETRLNTYFLRANAKVVIECRERFAAQVGDEMLVMAEAMAEEASRTTALLDLTRAKAVCGLADSESEFTPEQLIKQAEAQGSLVDDTAFIRQREGAKTYVIKSDLHALLMVAKIAHIDNEVARLLVSNERLVPRAIARRMLLAALLAEFETAMVEKAREHFEMLSKGPNPSPIQFPSLISSLGEYT